MTDQTRTVAFDFEVDELKSLLLTFSAIQVVFVKEDYLRFCLKRSVINNLDFFFLENGMGEEMHVLFSPRGTVLKGFWHESDRSPESDKVPGDPMDPTPIQELFEFIPKPLFAEFCDCLEDAEELLYSTFCYWQLPGINSWVEGVTKNEEIYDDDGLWFSYLNSARTAIAGFHEINLNLVTEKLPDLKFYKHVYAHKPFNATMIRELNPKRDAAEAIAELREIGYPVL